MFHSPVPALSTLQLSLTPLSLSRCLKIASAVGDRQMLPQHTNRTEHIASLGQMVVSLAIVNVCNKVGVSSCHMTGIVERR